MVLNEARNEVFRPFLEFRLYVFLEIAYNCRLGQCLRSSRGKTHKRLEGGGQGGIHGLV